MNFPISQREFEGWLDSFPQKKITADPLTAAVREINPDVDPFIGDVDFCFVSDLAHGGDQHRKLPNWALKVNKTLAKLGWGRSRGEMRAQLNVTK